MLRLDYRYVTEFKSQLGQIVKEDNLGLIMKHSNVCLEIACGIGKRLFVIYEFARPLTNEPNYSSWTIQKVYFNQIIDIWIQEERNQIEQGLIIILKHVCKGFKYCKINEINYLFTRNSEFIYRAHIDDFLPLLKSRLFETETGRINFSVRVTDINGGEQLTYMVDHSEMNYLLEYNVAVQHSDLKETFLNYRNVYKISVPNKANSVE